MNTLPMSALAQQLLNDHWIGLDHLLNRPTYTKTSFPPYDIIRSGEDYTIVVALAGYKADDLSISYYDNTLAIKSSQSITSEKSDKTEYVHKGIAKRSFTLSFNLSPEVVIDGSTLNDGMLTINMHRVLPESKLPKSIPIIVG